MTAKRNVSITLLCKVLLFFIGLGASILIARTLGPRGKGSYALAILIPSMIVSIGNLGIGTAVVYLLGGKRFGAGEVVGSSLLLAALLGGLYAAGAMALEGLGLLPWKNLPAGLLALGLISVPFWLARHYIAETLRALGRIGLYNLLQVLQPLLFLALLVVLVVLLETGVPGAVCAFLGALVAVAASGLVILLRHTPMRLAVRREFLRRALAYGLAGHIGNIGQKFNLRLDQLLIGAWLAPAQLGLYSVAVGLGELIWYLPDSIGIVLLPQIAARRSSARAAATCARLVRATALATLAAAAALALGGGFLITLVFGADFAPSATPLLFLLPGVVCLSLSKVLSKFFAGTGRPLLNTWASLASLAVTVVLCIALIPEQGIAGAAIASSAAYAVHAVVEIAFFARVSGLGLRALLAPPRAGGARSR